MSDNNRICFSLPVDPSTPLYLLAGEGPSGFKPVKPVEYSGLEDLEAAARRMVASGVDVGVVLDGEGKVKGLVYASDILLRMAGGGKATVGDVAKPASLTITVDMSVERSLETMLLYGVHATVVVDHEGRPLYVVRLSDIAGMLFEEIDVGELKHAD